MTSVFLTGLIFLKNKISREFKMKPAVNGFAKSHDGVNLNYVYYPADTDNPAVILSNGVMCVETYWVYLVKHLRGRYPVITWDYRGHGKSHVPDDPKSATMENHARDAASVLDDIGIEKAVHMGFSMGVQAAYEFYRIFPERTLGLVAVCGPYKHPYDEFFKSKTLGSALENVIRLGIKTHKVLKPVVATLVKTPLAFEVAKVVQVDRHRAKKEDMESYFEHMGTIDYPTGLNSLIEMNRHSAEDVLPRIDVPILIIAGEKDTMTPLRHNLEMHRLAKGSEFMVVPHGTHAAPIEQPQAINCRIELFLRDYFDYKKPGNA